MKLNQYSLLKGIMIADGVHIGTGEEVAKGEATPILKTKKDGLPYIPGSSMKGKIRSLLELKFGYEPSGQDKGTPCGCGGCAICLLFGAHSMKGESPSRLIFRDSILTEEAKHVIDKVGLENKPGVRIDRKTGKAAGGALFPSERIPHETPLDWEVSIRIFEGDNVDTIRRWLQVGLFLLEKDALGGGGTRGSGKVVFKPLMFDGKELQDWRKEAETDSKTLKREKKLQ